MINTLRLHRPLKLAAVTLTAILVAPASPARAGEAGVVSHVTVLSDKVPDVSSLEAWKRSVIKPGMTDEQKAMAVWETVVAFRHQESPPREYLDTDPCVHDPIKSFHVYGYNQCCCASAQITALARYAGLEARGWAITAHSVPEVKWDGAWHLLDASLVNYFAKPGGGVAGVEEIGREVAAFYEQHPELRNDDAKLRQFMRDEGWKRGPAVLANSQWYDYHGWLPAATHGWYATMQEYGRPDQNHLYEYGSAVGYAVNVQLRKGERLTRNWSNQGLHVNMAEGADLNTAKTAVGEGDLRYSPKFGDLAPGRVGNGVHEYDVPLADGSFRAGALVADNLATKAEAGGAGPAVQVKDAGKPGVLVLRMPSSYVYLGGQLTLDAAVGNGGSVVVSFSDNNGLDWKPVATVSKAGKQTIDLKPLVYRRYDYRLKFDLAGKGTGLNALAVRHDIQHSQRPLPALGEGTNTITFSAGPQEGTVTVHGSTNPDFKGKNVQLSDFHPQAEGLAPPPGLRPGDTGKGSVTFPIETPGDLTRLRIGAHYRARDARDGWDVSASFDGGKTFKTIDRLAGPYAGMSRYLTFGDVPPGRRSALVRFVGEQRNTAVIFDLRIDADYKEPAGGFAPVKVTYMWDENGQTKQDVHVAKRPNETYTIDCAAKPVMKSIAVELAK